MTELKKVLSDNDEFAVKENVEIVLHVIFIKHFFYSYYNLLHIGESPLQSLKLTFNGNEYTMPEILAKYRKQKKEDKKQQEKRLQELRTLMKESENRTVWVLLLLLGYEMQIEQIEKQLDDITTEPIQNLKKKEKNEKIDRIVWHVLANGTSELTNTENAVRKLRQDVLLKTGEARKQAWEKYMEDMYYQRLWKDNSTIFRLGLGSFLPLFQALEIVGADGQLWKMFLEFYFSQYKKSSDPQTISVALIENCNYCNLRNKNVFFQVIRFINQLEVAGNMNGEKSYKLFFQNYMGAVTSFGYSRRMESWMFEFPENLEQNKKFAEELIQELLEDLEKSRDKQKLDYIKDEFSDIIRFVRKNQELIQCENKISSRKPSFHVSEMYSKWTHQDEVDRLNKLKEEQPAKLFMAELEKSYREGKIYLLELQSILGKCE